MLCAFSLLLLNYIQPIIAITRHEPPRWITVVTGDYTQPYEQIYENIYLYLNRN
jgi:hypothetical protein